MLGLFHGVIPGGLSFFATVELGMRRACALVSSWMARLVPPRVFPGTFRSHILVEGVLMGNVAFYSVGIMQNNVFKN